MSRLKPESHERQELQLPLPPAEALEACVAAAGDLGWSAEPGEGDGEGAGRRLKVREDIQGKSPANFPMRLEIEVMPEKGGKGSAVNVDAFAPGSGSAGATHAYRGMKAYALCLARRAHGLPPRRIDA